jgi:hypothetical protein
MYIFAKFVSDHIFLQNRDKLNIKKLLPETPDLPCVGRRRVQFVQHNKEVHCPTHGKILAPDELMFVVRQQEDTQQR